MQGSRGQHGNQRYWGHGPLESTKQEEVYADDVIREKNFWSKGPQSLGNSFY